MSNKMVLESLTNNKEILNLLSPRVTTTRPSMLSPKVVLDAANLGKNYPGSPTNMEHSGSLISPK